MIDGVSRGAGPGKSPGVEAKTARGLEPAAAAATGSVQAPANSTLARIARELAASPPVDTAKVERLRNAIVAGEYRPDPQAIASAMLALEAPRDS